MSDEDRPPAWLPDGLKRHWDEGEFRPPGEGRWDFGDVPEGTELRVRAPSRNMSLVASSAGPGSKLVLVGDPRSHVVVEGFSVIHLTETLPQALMLSADANIHFLTGGTLQLRAVQSAEAATARVWFDEVTESPGTCALTTSVPLTGIHGKSSAAVDLRTYANAEGLPIAAGAKVDLPNCRSLMVHGQLERCEVTLPGRFVTTDGLVRSCQLTAGTVLVGPNASSNTWRPPHNVMADAGTTVRATTGKIAIAGRVQGTEDRPVILTGANEEDVQVGAAEHTRVQAADGQHLGPVTVGLTSHVQVRGASAIADYVADGGQHVAPDMEATTRIKLSGQLQGGRLQAEEVRVCDVVGPASLIGRTVALGSSAHEDGGTVSIEAAEWIKAASTCDLHVTTCGPDPCRLLVSQHHGNPAQQDRPLDPPPEDLLEEGVAELGRDHDETARLELHGPLQVECSAATTIVRAAERVVSLRTGGQLQMPPGGTVVQVRSAGDLHIGGDGSPEVVLDAHDIKASAILRGSQEGALRVTVEASGAVHTGMVNVDGVSCARLHADGDAHLGALRVTEDTYIGGRLSAAQGPAQDGEYRLTGTADLADVDVPLTLEHAHATIKASEPQDGPEGEARPASVIGELSWETPTGSLCLEHEVSVLRVKSPQVQAVLKVPVPAGCKRIEVDGELRVGGGTNASSNGGKAPNTETERDEVEHPRIVLADGSKLTLALVQPVWIDLRPRAEATVRIEDSRSVLHLVEEEGVSGRLALWVPRKGSDGGQTVRLQSSAMGATATQIPDQPTIVVKQGDLLLSGAFSDVLVLDSASGRGLPDAAPTTVHIPAETVVHQMRGVVALGEFHGRVTGAEAGHGLLHRFTSQDGPRWGWMAKLPVLRGLLQEPTVENRLVLVNPAAAIGGSGQEAISTGVLVGVDVTQLSFAELDRLKGLDVFSPDPVALERKARARPSRAAARQSNAQHLSRIAQLVEGRSVTGSVRSMANWAASTAHATTGRGFERIGRRVARTLGYGQRPLPALALLVVLVAVTTVVLSMTALEAGVCRSWFSNPTGAVAVAAYNWIQHLERVLLAPLAFLRVAGPLHLEPLGCNPLVQVVGTVLIALPLAFLLIGLRNYLRSPVDR